jgi:CO/xanthine dehydrogenase FAD-binding subunit
LPELFSGNGLQPFTLDADEVVTGVRLPLPGAGDGSRYVKMRLRQAIDYPLLAAAAALRLRGPRLEKALIVLGAVGPAPVAVEALTLFPEGRPERFQAGSFRDLGGLGPALVDNLALPGSYRKKMLPVMAEKALQGALQSMARKEQP